MTVTAPGASGRGRARPVGPLTTLLATTALLAAATALPAAAQAPPASASDPDAPSVAGGARATGSAGSALPYRSHVRGLAAADSASSAPFRRPSAGILAARRARLLEVLGTGTAVFRSAVPRNLSTDDPQASSFRQDDDFFYLTGLETPDSWLLLSRRADGRTIQRLYVPERDPAEERWTGRQPGPEEAARISGIEDVRPSGAFERAARGGELPLPAAPAPLHLPSGREALASEPIRALSAGSSERVEAVEPLVAGLRLVKDDFEISMLRRAAEVTDRGLRAAMAAARPGMYEYELEALVEYEFRRAGAERVGFPSIVGSGPNSVILHHDENRRRTEPGDLVVMDVGAEYSYYTADVTRTLPVSGRFTDRQRRLYRLVLGAQRAGIEAVRPGATLVDVERAARTHLREHSGGLCGSTSCEARFVHGVGHWLGLDVHDVGSYTAPFRPGMVLTVEPGVYLPEEGLGIRIEDVVLVTDEGREVLSRAPKTPEEVEAAMEDVTAEAALPARP